ncbi:MAG: hypothetical protein ACXV9R_13005 [Methylobacter sp.]
MGYGVKIGINAAMIMVKSIENLPVLPEKERPNLPAIFAMLLFL